MAVRSVNGAKAVGQLVPRLTQKAFERYGFAASELITNWSAIVGADLARGTVPERIKWPKASENGDEVRQPGGTLVLRVDGPRSIEVQMRTRQLLERINAYFGYRAVSGLRILQAPLSARSGEHPRAPAQILRPPVDVSSVRDERLRAALERMSRGIATRPVPVD